MSVVFESPYDTTAIDPGYTVKSVPGKGNCLVATRFLPRGTELMTEKAIMQGPKEMTVGRAQALKSEFNELSPSDQLAFKALPFSEEKVTAFRAYLRDLYQYTMNAALGDALDEIQVLVNKQFEEEMEIVGRFMWNGTTVAEDGAMGLFLESHGKIKHSCRPNVWVQVDQGVTPAVATVKVTRDVQEGQEITMCFVNPWMTFDQRRKGIMQGWGFTCRCAKCEEDEAAADGSGVDSRRLKEKMDEVYQAWGIDVAKEKPTPEQIRYAIELVGKNPKTGQ